MEGCMGKEGTGNWFATYCAEMEGKIGRGWKRRLAEKVGVSESNVQTWLRSGRVPPAVQRAILLNDELEELKMESAEQKRTELSRWIEEEPVLGEVRYSVHEMNLETGRARLVAGDIRNEGDAREIANLPMIKEQIDEAVNKLWLGNMYDSLEDRTYVKFLENPGWRNLTLRERNARRRKSFSEGG